MLLIMRTLEEAGTGFAFPSQTAYLARDTAPDPTRLETRRPSADRPEQAPIAVATVDHRRAGTKG
jgi:hypothetical protein